MSNESGSWKKERGREGTVWIPADDDDDILLKSMSRGHLTPGGEAKRGHSSTVNPKERCSMMRKMMDMAMGDTYPYTYPGRFILSFDV